MRARVQPQRKSSGGRGFRSASFGALQASFSLATSPRQRKGGACLGLGLPRAVCLEKYIADTHLTRFAGRRPWRIDSGWHEALL